MKTRRSNHGAEQFWTAVAERSGDTALASRGADHPAARDRSAGPQSGVALRFPPQSKTSRSRPAAPLVSHPSITPSLHPSTTPPLRPVSPRAFTLIEMMMVVGIIAIIMAVGIPAFVQARKKSPMRQAISDVMEAVSHARAQAILRGVQVDLVVRPADGAFSVSASGGDAASAAGGGEHAKAGFSVQLSGDVVIVLVGVNFVERKDDEEVRVRFHPNGTSDAFSVALRSSDGDTQAISVDMISALAYVETPK